jgi:hypothetical protein
MREVRRRSVLGGTSPPANITVSPIGSGRGSELVRICLVDEGDRKRSLSIPFVDIAAGEDSRSIGSKPPGVI